MDSEHFVLKETAEAFAKRSAEMTPEERQAQWDKMRSIRMPEENMPEKVS